MSKQYGLMLILMLSGVLFAANADFAMLETIAANAVDVAATGLGSVLKDTGDQAVREKIIRDFIADVRFFPDGTGYFYVYDFAGRNVAHPINPKLVGQLLIEKQDEKGGYPIRTLVGKAQSGGGFVDFRWPHPKTGIEEIKKGYVRPIPNTPYWIGTGVYGVPAE